MAFVDLLGQGPLGVLVHADELVYEAEELVHWRVFEREPMLERRLRASIALFMDVRAHLVVCLHF